MAFGMGFGMAQRTNVIASVVDPGEIGIASSILALVRNIAGAFGIAVFSTVLNSRIKENMLTIGHFSVLHSHARQVVMEFVALMELKAQVDAYDYIFMLSGIIVMVGAFAILTLRLKHERTNVTVHVE